MQIVLVLSARMLATTQAHYSHVHQKLPNGSRLSLSAQQNSAITVIASIVSDSGLRDVYRCLCNW